MTCNDDDDDWQKFGNSFKICTYKLNNMIFARTLVTYLNNTTVSCDGVLAF